MATQPYLFFEGKTEEAFEFYRKALGAEVQMLLRYKDAPGGSAKCPDGSTPPAALAPPRRFDLSAITDVSDLDWVLGAPAAHKIVFGKVVDGFETLDRLEAVHRGPDGQTPLERVELIEAVVKPEP